jgi:hypothetical protein
LLQKNFSFTKIFYLFQNLTIDTLVIGADDQECKVLLEKKAELVSAPLTTLG